MRAPASKAGGACEAPTTRLVVLTIVSGTGLIATLQPELETVLALMRCACQRQLRLHSSLEQQQLDQDGIQFAPGSRS